MSKEPQKQKEQKKIISASRIVYFILACLVGLVFMLRFACDNGACVSNTFFFDSNSICKEACDTCESLMNDFSMVNSKKSEKACNYCKKCNADWNVRTAFDGSGLALIGLFLSMIFLLVKNYSLKEFWKGIEGVNLFGVLSLKVDRIEEEIEALTNDIQEEVLDENVYQKATKVYESITEKSTSPVDSLHLIVEKIEIESRKVGEYFLEQKNNIGNDKRQSQFDKLTTAFQSLMILIKQDRGNKFINTLIIMARKTLTLLYGIMEHILPSPYTKKAIYLSDDLGVGVNDDEFSVIIKKGTEIPAKNEGLFFTLKDNQESVVSSIYIGSNKVASNNIEIGQIKLTGIPKMPAKKAEHTISFNIDKSRHLLVEQVCKETNKTVKERFDINKYCRIKW